NHERVAVFLAGANLDLRQFGHWQARTSASRNRLAHRGGLVLDLAGDGFGLARWFRRSVEPPFSPVFFELAHGGILSQTFLRPSVLSGIKLTNKLPDKDSSCFLRRWAANLKSSCAVPPCCRRSALWPRPSGKVTSPLG